MLVEALESWVFDLASWISSALFLLYSSLRLKPGWRLHFRRRSFLSFPSLRSGSRSSRRGRNCHSRWTTPQDLKVLWARSLLGCPRRRWWNLWGLCQSILSLPSRVEDLPVQCRLHRCQQYQSDFRRRSEELRRSIPWDSRFRNRRSFYCSLQKPQHQLGRSWRHRLLPRLQVSLVQLH